MRFSITTQAAIFQLWVDGVSMERIAACYLTTVDTIEHIIRVQLRTKVTK